VTEATVALKVEGLEGASSALASHLAASVAMLVVDMERSSGWLAPATASATAVSWQEAAMEVRVVGEKHTKRPGSNEMALWAAWAVPVPPMAAATKLAKRVGPMVAALAGEEGHSSVLHCLKLPERTPMRVSDSLAEDTR
jgi:hypothetical protein